MQQKEIRRLVRADATCRRNGAFKHRNAVDRPFAEHVRGAFQLQRIDLDERRLQIDRQPDEILLERVVDLTLRQRALEALPCFAILLKLHGIRSAFGGQRIPGL